MKRKLLLSAAALAVLAPWALQAEISDLASDVDVTAGVTGVDVSALFDNDNTTGANFATGTYITWQCKAPYTLEKYSITGGGNANLNPRNWTLEGSNDNKEWVRLDKKSAQTINVNAERTFTIAEANRLPFRYFRLVVETVKGGGNRCAINELHLYGEKGVLPAAPSDIRVRPGAKGMEIAWRDNSNNEEGFVLERSFNGKSWSTIAELKADETAFTDVNVPTGVGAVYRVGARIGAVISDYSSTGVISTGTPDELTDVVANRDCSVDGTNPINANENGLKGADGNKFTKYLSTKIPATLTVSLAEPVVMLQYAVTSANDAAERDPRNWVVEGSKDGSTWTVLDTKENQSFNARFQTYRYRTDNKEAYSNYRITVSAVNGGNIMQFGEFSLFADIEPRKEVSGLKAPDDLRVNVRTYNQMELLWTDNNDGEECYVIQRSTDGENWNRDYITQPNDQRCCPYSLKANTTYYYRIAAKAGESMSEWSNVVSATTPTDEWPDTWPNFNFDGGYHTGNLVKKYSNDDIAIFVNPNDVNAEGVSLVDLDLSWMIEPYTKMWNAIRDTFIDEYGEYLLSAPKLYIVPHYHADGGGLGRLFTFRDADQLYRNIVHISVGKNSGWRWENHPGTGNCNFLYDVLTHEVGHIVEATASGKKNSPFYPVWLDSKWAEILQYDIFGKMDPYHQKVWHDAYMIPLEHKADEPTPNSEWYIGFFYPTYANYGGDKLFQRFFALKGKYYFQKDGDLQGNGTLGELIHFWSGGAGHDVTSYAKNAFGWNEEFELQLLEARNRYPMITYESDDPVCNLLRLDEAVLTSDAAGSTTLGRINDGDYSSVFDAATKNTDKEWVEVTYRAKNNSSTVHSTKLVVGSNKTSRPQSVEIMGSNDGETWEKVLAITTAEFDGDNALTYDFETPVSYTYFKLRLKVTKSKYVSMMINEWELKGELAPANPSALRGLWDGSAVKLSWSAPYKDLDKFEIERAEVGGDFVKIGETDIMNLTFTDEDAAADKDYLYRVREIGNDFVSPYSNVLKLHTGEAGIQVVVSDPASIPSMLDLYPKNNVEIHNIAGVCVVSQSMSSSDWYEVNTGGRLPQGVYIVSIDFNGEASAIRTKIIVK